MVQVSLECHVTAVIASHILSPSLQEPARVLVVDDDPSIRAAILHVLRHMGHEVWTADNGEEGIRVMITEGPFDAAIVDLKMPKLDGMQLFEAIRGRDPSMSVVIVTGHASVESAIQTFRQGAFDYVTKPFDNIFEVCQDVVMGAVAKTREQRKHQPGTDTMVGSPPKDQGLAAATFVGRQLSGYVLERKIGAGGMGEVWLAGNRALGNKVAIKIHRPGAVGSSSERRFEQEAQIFTRLNHPNTVRVSDFGVTADGLTYYVMEYLEGEDLGSVLEREGTIPPMRAIHYVTQACGALHEAHGLGVTHRDIKPDNLFVTCLGGIADFIKVLDFGVATWKGAAKITISAPWIGTPAYISPEVVAGGAADARSDIYSLGGVLYHMLSGRRPFPYDNVAALLLAQVNEPAPPLSEAASVHISPVLEDIVMKCLEKAPEDRYQSAADLAFALNRYARGAFWTTAEHIRVVTTT